MEKKNNRTKSNIELWKISVFNEEENIENENNLLHSNDSNEILNKLCFKLIIF